MNHVHRLTTHNYRSAKARSAIRRKSQSSSCTTEEDTFSMDYTMTVAPMRGLHGKGRTELRKGRVEPDRKKQDHGKRKVELGQLELEKQELAKRSVEPSQLKREIQVLTGQVMALTQELAKNIQKQQNAPAVSPQREATIRRLARNLSKNFLNLSASNLLRSPLGKKTTEVSKPTGSIEFAAAPKPPASIEFAAAPTLENYQMSEFPERKAAASKSIRKWDRAKLERYTSRTKVSSRRGIRRQDAFMVNRGDLEQISSSYEQNKKDADSKIPRSIEFDGTKKTGHNLKLQAPRSYRMKHIVSL
jgi:hypothetical protein